MQNQRRSSSLIWIPALWFLLVSLSHGAGLLTPADGSLPALQIRQQHVRVIIEDAYAVTRVEQVFHNPNPQDLEAVYSFPVPEKASVAEFTMWIDGRPISGEVLEKKQARQIYEKEKKAGRETGLTEKDGYKTFDIHVFPVRAQQDIKIRLMYFQPVHVDTGIGRYVYPLEEGGVDEARLAFWTAEKKVREHFSFHLKIKPAYPVAAVRVPGGHANIQQGNNGEWEVVIDSKPAGGNTAAASGKNTDGAAVAEGGASVAAASSGTAAGSAAYNLNKDIVVYWRHQSGLPGSVDMIAYKPDAAKRGTFMLVLTPGEDLKPITRGKDWIFVLDISGSMQGKYTTLAQGVSRALKKLRTQDRFRIILFNDAARELTSGYVDASPGQVSRYIADVSAVSPGGGTNLFAGLKLGIHAIAADRTTGIVLVTDGVANVGETRQKMFLQLLKQKDVRLFTAIMGNSANRPLLNVLTRASHGFAANISNSDDIVGKVLEMSSKITHEAMHGVSVDIKGVKVSSLAPANIGSLYRGQQLVLFGHYWGDGMADVTLRARISGKDKRYQTRFNFPATALENPEIERLWAYAKIRDISDEMESFGEKADLKKAVVDLAVQYGLVTDYTSMLILRDELFQQHGIKRRNAKRLQVEWQAQQQRRSRSAVSRRVDASQPMYTRNRPTYSGGGGGGGGSMGPWLLLLIPLWWLRRRRNR